MSRKIISILIILCMALSICACTSSNKDENNSAEAASIKILCTLFPQYDWVKNIVSGADNVSVSLIIANGTDPHSYQPTAADIMNISSCDMLIYVGGDSDTWVKEAIKQSNNENLTAIALADLDDITLHNISSSSHSHDGEEHEGHAHSVLDEHLYLSINNATEAVGELATAISALDPASKELYHKNALEYIVKLKNLSDGFKNDIKDIPEESRFILFADRFPFVYLLSDYGIDYSAAFEGCTTDVDADFDTVIRLAKEADEHNVKYIAVTESSDKSLANTVILSTKSKDQKIITLNSMQSVTNKQIESGATYLSIMESNINEVKTALGIK